VLGCTHFPLLSAAIQQVMGRRVRLISSAQETAREVVDTLAARRQLAPEGSVARVGFATTGDAEEFARLGSRVLRRKIAAAEHVPLGDLETVEVPAPRRDTCEGSEEAVPCG
jgi:glutamate racemase